MYELHVVFADQTKKTTKQTLAE